MDVSTALTSMVRRVASPIMPSEPGSRVARALTRRHLGLPVPDLVPQAPAKPDLLRRSVIRVGSCVVKAATSVPVAPGFCPSPALLTRSFVAKAQDYAENRAWFTGSDPHRREFLAPMISPTLSVAAPKDLKRRLDRVLGTKRAKAERAKRARARERQAKFVRRLRASAGVKTILEELSMGTQAAQDYERRRTYFWEFAARWSLPLTDDDLTFDVAMCDWADHQFLDGEQCHVGEKLKAALDEWATQHRRRGVLTLPRFRRVLRSWKKNGPKRSRLPQPLEYNMLVTHRLATRGHRSMGPYYTGLSVTYLRPSAFLRLMIADVVPPVAGVGSEDWVLIISPFEKGISTKTGYFDETVLLANRAVPEYGKLLGEHIAQRRRAALALDPTLLDDQIGLWDFNAKEFLTEWRLAVDDLGLAEDLGTPHQARHGGASYDTIMKYRTPAEVVDRGHWSTLTSARIYNKPGRIQKLVAKLSESSLDLANRVRTHFTSWYQSGSLPEPLARKRGRAAADPRDLW